MKRLNVQVSPAVKQQIRDQVLHISRDSIENALGWEDRLLVALEALGDFHSHAIDEDASDRLGGKIHKFVFENTYLIHYDVNEATNVVEVVNFRHGARLPRRGEP